MPLDCLTLPCLSDNYAFLLVDRDTGDAAVVDVPEAAPIQTALAEGGWRLTTVLLTHHHPDHVQGLAALAEGRELAVIGAAADAHRLPDLTEAVAEGDRFTLLGERVEVMDVSGHTIGHIAFHMPGIGHAFTADSLMAMGCGRLFEGTPAQMWESLQKLRALPEETVICSGHEYTLTNARFAAGLEPQNADIISRLEEAEKSAAAGRPTVPSSLSLERRTNPFLRADDPGLARAVGLEDAPAVEVFAEVRRRRDGF